MKGSFSSARSLQDARILVVDDHPLFREGVIQTIARERGLSVCGEAGDAANALDLVQKLLPDLVIIDLTLPGRSGLELIKDIHVLLPDLPLLVLSMHDEAVFAERVLKAGGRGYLMKHEATGALLDAIRQVLSGRIYVSAKVAERVILSFSGKGPAVTGSAVASLTDREFEIFRLIGAGLDSTSISEQLHLSPKTVAVHKSNIKEKLRMKSSSELMRFAIYWEANPMDPGEEGTSLLAALTPRPNEKRPG
jgi:DNA-binding NarL/FixJ family response regulator